MDEEKKKVNEHPLVKIDNDSFVDEEGEGEEEI